MTRVAAQGSGTLGISFALGLVISLWGANSGIKALFDALNVVYEEKESRSFIQLNAITLLFTIGTMVFLLIALTCVIALPVALDYLPLTSVSALSLKLARWPILGTRTDFPETTIDETDHVRSGLCCPYRVRHFSPTSPEWL